MKVVITGGGGFLGYRIAQALLKKGTIADADGKQAPVTEVVLYDLAFPENVDSRMTCVKGDMTDQAAIEAALGGNTSSVFHLASVMSGGAEADFDLGMRVNIDGIRNLLNACRKQARPPRFVFSSGIAAFGGDMPEVLDDSTMPHPQSSYGMQKVCCEYFLTDYTRKGFVDGRALRLPTICIRPGKPNQAASSFVSGIIREPLNGLPALCPVGRDSKIWILSPSKVIEAFIHAHDLPSSAWGVNRVVNLPGVTVSVGEMIDTLRQVAGDKVADRIEMKPDSRIEAIVLSWPARFKTERALKLGFSGDKDFESILNSHIKDQGIMI